MDALNLTCMVAEMEAEALITTPGPSSADVTFAVDVEPGRDVAHFLHNCSKGFDSFR